MPGLGTWFERFVNADRVLVFLNSCEYADTRAYWGFESGLEAIARDKEPEPVISIEDITVKNPDKSKWESFCGKYEHTEEGVFTIDDVFMKDGELYAEVVSDLDRRYEIKMYPVGDNTFSFKEDEDDTEIEFRDGCYVVDDEVHKKL